MTIPIWNNKDRLMDGALFYTICAFSLFEEFEVRPYFILLLKTLRIQIQIFIQYERNLLRCTNKTTAVNNKDMQFS